MSSLTYVRVNKCIFTQLESFLYVSYIWGLLSFLYLWIYSYHQIGNFLAINSPNGFFGTPSFRDCNYAYIRLLKAVPKLTGALFILLFLLFFSVYFFLDSFGGLFVVVAAINIYSSSLIFSSAMSNDLLLLPSRIFFTSEVWFGSFLFNFFT